MRAPVLFGSPTQQHRLLEVYRRGSIPSTDFMGQLPMRAALLFEFKGKSRRIALDPRHPCYSELLDALRVLNGGDSDVTTRPHPHATSVSVDPDAPLLELHATTFRIMHCIAVNGPLMPAELRLRVPDLGYDSVQKAIRRLRARDVLAESDKIRFTKGIPDEFLAFVRKLGDHLAIQDARFRLNVAGVDRVPAYNSASDGAPRLFGTDVRLRHLMALAKYGPMYLSDLNRLIGTHYIKPEGRDQAPFGRANLVRVWVIEDGTGVALDAGFPAHDALREFLLAMERAYPIPEFKPRMQCPKFPPPQAWHGDKLALFGSPIPTSVLLSLAGMGWTFEALCCDVATGYHRENVKRAMMRLETERVIVGDRKRKPGFNVRVVRLNPEFPAAGALGELINTCGRDWGWSEKVARAMERLHPRTKEHLRRRGLLSGGAIGGSDASGWLEIMHHVSAVRAR